MVNIILFVQQESVFDCKEGSFNQIHGYIFLLTRKLKKDFVCLGNSTCSF